MTQRNSAAGMARSGSPEAMILAPSLAAAVDLYWLALLNIQNTIEDVEGADGRLEYLHGLKYRLIDYVQLMDGVLSPMERRVEGCHRIAFALDRGFTFLELDGEAVVSALHLDRGAVDYETLRAALISFGDKVLSRLPGRIPAAQGPTGQREVLKAMRNWSAAAAKTGDDLTFLADRIVEL